MPATSSQRRYRPVADLSVERLREGIPQIIRTTVYECPVCSAVVVNQRAHTASHDRRETR